MLRRRRTVVLIGGWSWHRHVGDDAILRAHLSELERALPRHRVRVACAEPERLAERMGVDALWTAAPAISALLGPEIAHDEVRSGHLLPVVDDAVARGLANDTAELPHFVELVEAIRSADAVVAAAAGSLTAAYPLTVAEQVVVLRIAQALGKPTVVSGASLGPFDGPDDEALLRPALAAADLVAVRDEIVSPPLARALGVDERRLRIQPDPAFWMEPAGERALEGALSRAGVERTDEIGLLTVAPWPGGADQVAPLAAVVDAVAEVSDTRFLGVPMYLPPGPADDAALDAVRARVADPDSLIRLDPLPDDPELLALSGLARVVVGSRFHGAVLAAAAGTPAVLVHDGEYQRNKAESLDASLDAVRAVPLEAGPDAIADAVHDLLAEPSAPFEPDGRLPAVAWLADELGPSRRAGRRVRRRPRRDL